MGIEIKRVYTLEDLEECRHVAISVWGEGEACSVSQMVVYVQYGGVVLLARDGMNPIGFTLSFPVKFENEWVLWSHETAVLPEYAHRGIGFILKNTQRESAREIGYRHLMWTFDPLVARNAHFNLNKLNAHVVGYKENQYGNNPSDRINCGLDTDRFLVRWSTGESEAKRIAPGAVNPIIFDHHVANDNAYYDQVVPSPDQIMTVIPNDFGSLIVADYNQAFHWRHSFRSVAEDLFRNGFSPVSLIRDSRRTYYLWMRDL